MSLGLSMKGRRSMPTTGRSRCRTRARRLPRRPQMPVTRTAGPSVAHTIDGVRLRGAEEGGDCAWLSTIGCPNETRHDRQTVSPKNVFPLFEAAVQHRLDGLFHQPYLLLHDRVIVVRIPREAQRFAKPDSVFGGEWKLPAGQEERREEGERGQAQELREPLHVGHGDVLLFPADDSDRNDGRAVSIAR